MSIPSTIFAEEEKKSKEIEVKSSILMCMDTGDIISEENAYEHMSPASVTKIMSILLIMEAIDSGKISLDDMVAASENAVSKGGSQIWLEVGEQMSVNDLLKAVIISSANDACTLLSEYVAGSASGFVDMMNAKVKELGLKDSNFENCTGLDDDVTNHYSCAYDLAVISSEVMKHKLVMKYTTIWLDSLRNGKTELNNTNKLINSFNGITGLKTGTTSNAGFCVSATAKRDGMHLVAVVLGSETSNDRFDAAAYLLDYGFANYQIVKPEINKKKIKEVAVSLGEEKTVKPVMKNSSKICIEKNNSEISYKYNIVEKVEAPVKKGASLGEIVVLADKKQIGKIELVSDKSISRLTLKAVFMNIILKI